MAKVKFRTTCMIAGHGSFVTDDVLTCSDEMARHLVVDCMAADYCTPPAVSDELGDMPVDPRIEAAVDEMDEPEVTAPVRRGRPPKAK
jgi:hypothetical protein